MICSSFKITAQKMGCVKLFIIAEWVYRVRDIYVRMGTLLLPIISSLSLIHEMCSFIAVHYDVNLMQIDCSARVALFCTHFNYENAKYRLCLLCPEVLLFS